MSFGINQKAHNKKVNRDPKINSNHYQIVAKISSDILNDTRYEETQPNARALKIPTITIIKT